MALSPLRHAFRDLSSNALKLDPGKRTLSETYPLNRPLPLEKLSVGRAGKWSRCTSVLLIPLRPFNAVFLSCAYEYLPGGIRPLLRRANLSFWSFPLALFQP